MDGGHGAGKVTLESSPGNIKLIAKHKIDLDVQTERLRRICGGTFSTF